MRTLTQVENEIQHLVLEERIIIDSKYMSDDEKRKSLIDIDTLLMKLHREAEFFHWQEIAKLREKKWTNPNIISGDKYIRDDIAEDCEWPKDTKQ
jgi:hypothetical protein